MSGRYFLDTNIFVYTFDSKNSLKKGIATALVENALKKGTGVISTQVVQEFLNVALRKFINPLSPRDAKEYLATVLSPLCEVYPSSDYYKAALEIHESTGYAFYDALIIAAAQQSACAVLYSEDLQNAQQLGQVKIIDPFLEKQIELEAADHS